MPWTEDMLAPLHVLKLRNCMGNTVVILKHAAHQNGLLPRAPGTDCAAQQSLQEI